MQTLPDTSVRKSDANKKTSVQPSILTDENGNIYRGEQLATNAIPVVESGDRVSEKIGRQGFSLSREDVTTNTVIREVTEGKTFYIKTLLLSYFNDSGGNTLGRVVVTDGTTRIPFVSRPNSAINPVAIDFLDPIPMNGAISLLILSGEITAAVFIRGYEE